MNLRRGPESTSAVMKRRAVSAARWLRRDPSGVVRVIAELARDHPVQPLQMWMRPTGDEKGAYDEWITRTEPGNSALRSQRRRQHSFSYTPRISIITPVFRPPAHVLRQMIESVLDQTYANLQLCLGDFSNDTATYHILGDYAKSDSRVALARFPMNEGIARNSQRCSELCTGDYIALLDHDDTLAPDALFEAVSLLNREPADFIYSDRDKLDERGQRGEPFFKPGWSPEILYSANYLTHFNVFSRQLFASVNGWSEGTDGAQDWDLFARMLRQNCRIAHIPKVLYHWRISDTSTAKEMRSKPYALAAQLTTVERLLRSSHLDASICADSAGRLHVRWHEHALERDTSVIVVGTSAQRTRRCLRRLASVIDPARVAVLPARRGPWHVVPADLAAVGATSATVVMLDTVAFRGKRWLRDLVGWLSVPGVSAASPKLLSRGGALFDAGRVALPELGYVPLFRSPFSRYGGIFGSSEWYRNFIQPARDCFAISSADVPIEARSFTDVFEHFARSRARVVSAFDVVGRITDPPRKASSDEPSPISDPYWNVHLTVRDNIPAIAL